MQYNFLKSRDQVLKSSMYQPKLNYEFKYKIRDAKIIHTSSEIWPNKYSMSFIEYLKNYLNNILNEFKIKIFQ